MNDSDDNTEQANRRVRPWLFGLLAVIVVSYGGFTLTQNSGWDITFSLLMLAGGLVVLVVCLRELISFRRNRG